MVKHRKEVEGLATWIERHICLPETVYITAGCDVQEDRLETTIVGHGRDGTMFVLGHQTLWGSPRSC
jgi:phage terminase large subunit GpA-like protein